MKQFEEPNFGTRQTGMFVPEGFFAEFQSKLEAKIDSETEHTEQDVPAICEHPTVWQKYRRMVTRWSVAACVCLIVGLFGIFAWQSADTNEPVQTAQTDSSKSMDEIEMNELEREDYMLASLTDYDIYEYFYAVE